MALTPAGAAGDGLPRHLLLSPARSQKMTSAMECYSGTLLLCVLHQSRILKLENTLLVVLNTQCVCNARTSATFSLYAFK